MQPQLYNEEVVTISARHETTISTIDIMDTKRHGMKTKYAAKDL